MKTHVTYEHDNNDQLHDFFLSDAKGRRIGARIWLAVATSVEIADDSRGWSNLPPGVYFAWCPHATRNGNTYGATQEYRYCKTEDERAQAIAKYLADARKRAAKIAKVA